MINSITNRYQVCSRFLNRGSALFNLLIRPVSRFCFSDGEILVLSLSIPLQIKYMLTGQLYMQVPVNVLIMDAFKIKSKKCSWLVHKLYCYSPDLSWALKFVSHILRQMGYLLKRFHRICRIFSTPFFNILTPFLHHFGVKLREFITCYIRFQT